MMAFVTFKPIPYGKTYTRGSSLLHTELPDRLSVILINLPILIIFVYAQLYFPNGDLFSTPSLLYIGHYVHRSLIYPFFRSTQSKPWPLESFLYFFFINTCLGTIAARGLIFGGIRLPLFIQLPLSIGFVVCAVGAGIHDYKLCLLRKSGDTGYQVPQGLLFKWVSGPNYLLELLQWIFFIWFLPIGFLMMVFGMWLLVNISGRAEWNHDAYTKRLFRNKYPEDRCPYVPFVEKSRWLI
jgi:hypothetical protein